jgi:exodeoxyribonuclease V alpha subunit
MASINPLWLFPMERNEFRGMVESTRYSGDRFTAGQFRSDSGHSFPVVGCFRIEDNQSLKIRGRWECNKSYGWQFTVDQAEFDLKFDGDGLIRYLAMNPDITGIGPARAQQMVDVFGDDFENVLLESPERIAKTCKIAPAIIEQLRDKWHEDRYRNHLMVRLAAFGLTNYQSEAAFKAFGAGAVQIIEKNPYRLIGKARGLGFKTVDGIASGLGVTKSHPDRIKAGFNYILDQAQANGDCYLEYYDLMRKTKNLLATGEDRIKEILSDILDGGGGLGAECIDGHKLIGQKRLMTMERELSEIFARGDEQSPHIASFTEARRGLAGFAPELNEKQLQALRCAMDFRISLITGGAGTGKTHLLRKLAELAELSGKTVTLAAPTGKAAKRLEEMVGMEAQTIHQLLGYNGSCFRDLVLGSDLVFVDESSMISSDLGWQFYHSVDFRRTSVVMVGDHHQLPPIGPGNILRDLVNSEAIPITELEQVMRQRGVLKDKCTKLLSGTVDREEADGVWYVIDQFQDAEKIQGIILDILLDKIDNMGFDQVRDLQILCPTHEGPLGTYTLNRLLQKKIQRKLHGVEVPEGAIKLLTHDKVIQTRNNYDLGVMNGTIGYVSKINVDGTLSINFDGVGTVELAPDSEELYDIELAYALTIHKAQGSEFPCVISVIHRSHCSLPDRNMLYTAATRSRQMSVIIGDAQAIDGCAKRNQTVKRKTFLEHWLNPCSFSLLKLQPLGT